MVSRSAGCVVASPLPELLCFTEHVHRQGDVSEFGQSLCALLHVLADSPGFMDHQHAREDENSARGHQMTIVLLFESFGLHYTPSAPYFSVGWPISPVFPPGRVNSSIHPIDAVKIPLCLSLVR